MVAVADLNEIAFRQRVHSRIEELFGAEFTAQDLLPRVGRRGEAAWQNNVDSMYDQLKHRGEMLPSTRGGPWRLSPSAIGEAERLHPPRSTPDSGIDLLADFKPKDSSEYLARLQGRVIEKRRDHEETLRMFGTAIALLGWKPSTSVHPRDLELSRQGTTCLVEVKQVYDGNTTLSVREAVAQLLEYRHFFYSDTSSPPHMLAVFSEFIGEAHASYLATLNIASVWKLPAGTWHGSQLARRWTLVPG